MNLTVAICTYRRIEPLRGALESLAACEPIDCAWELLVVDNAADSVIGEVVDSFSQKLPVRYVPEQELGTSFARNLAVREAQAPVILFTDDDVTFEPTWLSRMWRAIEQNPACDFWGGRVDPVWDLPIPSWFDIQRSPILSDCVVRYQRGDVPRYWEPLDDPPFYTANLALRVSRVADVGYFDTAVGHRGGARMGMEDSLMVRAIAGRGGRGWYAADAVVHHPVPPSRLTRRFARGFAWRQGWLSTQVHRQQDRVPRWLYRVALTSLFAGVGHWAGGLVRFNPAEQFAGQLSALFNLSKLYHAMRPSDQA